MNSFDLKCHPHRRFNPLRREWVLVSPHRTQRPWRGQMETAGSGAAVKFDPGCYLCPGNIRARGARNPVYQETFVFENDFAALREDTPEGKFREGELLLAESEKGRCRVVCFSPRHDLTLARMDVRAIQSVVDAWCDEFKELGGQPSIQSVQIFENRGSVIGCSNPHPHGQIWANETVPDELAREVLAFREYLQVHQTTMLGHYLGLELEKRERLVCVNNHFVALVPFWAVWPFETLLISRSPVPSLLDLCAEERAGLAKILKQITVRYDNLFEAPFPYTMGFHQAPTDGRMHPDFHFHLHLYPPLLRGAAVKKFMVGYEMLAMPQRDITAEDAARRLREVSSNHYGERGVEGPSGEFLGHPLKQSDGGTQ